MSLLYLNFPNWNLVGYICKRHPEADKYCSRPHDSRLLLFEMCEKCHSLFLKVAFWINGLEINSLFYMIVKYQLCLIFFKDSLIQLSLKWSTVFFLLWYSTFFTGIHFPLSVLAWMCCAVLLSWSSRGCLKGIVDYQSCYSKTS